MKLLKKSGLFFVLSLYSCSALPLKLPMPVVDVIKSHPFIIAVGIVIFLNNDPLDHVKKVILYLAEEHPIISTIFIGLLLTCSLDDLGRIQRASAMLVKILVRCFCLFSRVAEMLSTNFLYHFSFMRYV